MAPPQHATRLLDRRADRGSELIANNRRLLASAAQKRSASRALIRRTEETVVNAMETRIRLAHERLRALHWSLPDLP